MSLQNIQEVTVFSIPLPSASQYCVVKMTTCLLSAEGVVQMHRYQRFASAAKCPSFWMPAALRRMPTSSRPESRGTVSAA